MDRWGSAGIPMLSFLGVLLLLGAGTSSLILDQSSEVSNDFEEVTKDVLDEVSTYVMVKDVIGLFDSINANAELQKIIILAKPLLCTNINISDMHLQINDGNALYSFSYNGSYSKADGDIFKSRVWKEIGENEFGIIVLTDSDNSIEKGYLNTDLVYFAMKIPSSLHIHPGDQIISSIVAMHGHVENVDIVTPFILDSNIVHLDYYY